MVSDMKQCPTKVLDLESVPCHLAFIGLYTGESEREARRLGGVLCPGRPPGQKMLGL